MGNGLAQEIQLRPDSTRRAPSARHICSCRIKDHFSSVQERHHREKNGICRPAVAGDLMESSGYKDSAPDGATVAPQPIALAFKPGFTKCNTSADATTDIQVLKNRNWNSDQPVSKKHAYIPLCPQAPLDIFSSEHHTKSTERLDACRCPVLSLKTIQLKQRDHSHFRTSCPKAQKFEPFCSQQCLAKL